MGSTGTTGSHGTNGSPGTSGTSGSSGSTSDRLVKTDITPFTDGLDVLRKIQPQYFTYTGEAGTEQGKRCIGLIAQDVAEVVPYCVSTYKKKLTPTAEKEQELYWIIDTPVMWVMLNSIKELDARLKVMEGKL